MTFIFSADLLQAVNSEYVTNIEVDGDYIRISLTDGRVMQWQSDEAERVFDEIMNGLRAVRVSL